MKTFNINISKLLFIGMTCLVFIVTSCKKGDIGPEGPQGEQGIRGEKGEDGTTIYSGTVVPPENLGNAGDFYFRTSNSNFYGPKTAEGWGTPTSLRGPTGAAGAKILSGTTVPAANVGAVGDFYLRTSNAALYGPKTASGWPTTFVNLRGPQGPAGNANVISKTFLPANITWRQTTLFGTNYVTASLNIPEITSGVINSGSIQVYGGFFWGDPWSALPISYFESGRTVHFSYGIRQGSVTLRMHYSNNAAPTAPGIQFRVVVIPSQAVAKAKQHQVDLTDHDQVQHFFQLERDKDITW